MRFVRVGMIFLVVGASLLVATILRAKPVVVYSGGQEGLVGPYLFEPRQITIVLKDVRHQNVTVAVVNAQDWCTIQDVSKVDPVFAASGMNKLDRVTFKVTARGLYYIMVITSSGTLAGEIRLSLEQRGYAEDFLWISGIVSGIGVVMSSIHLLKFLRHHE